LEAIPFRQGIFLFDYLRDEFKVWVVEEAVDLLRFIFEKGLDFY